MKFFITGGTGFVGTHLVDRLSREGHDVTVLSRGSLDRGSTGAVRVVLADPTKSGNWQDEVAQHDVLVNLAGASIFGRWTSEHKQTLKDSRILTTRHLVDAIRPESKTLLFSTSAVGYYGSHEDKKLDESSPPGDDFLADLAKEWEAEALKAKEKGARVVITRFGIVLGRNGGALEQMIAPFKRFVGGPIGTGRQWISWVHLHDVVAAYMHLLDHPDLSGAFNFTAPNPVQNQDFSKTLGQVLNRPSWVPAPAFMVKLMLGEFGSVILKGQRVLPKRLLESGYSFEYSELEVALRDLLQ